MNDGPKFKEGDFVIDIENGKKYEVINVFPGHYYDATTKEAYVYLVEDDGALICRFESEVKPNNIVKIGSLEYIIPDVFSEPTQCCHSNKYKNVISKTLSFWYCPDCKDEVTQ